MSKPTHVARALHPLMLSCLLTAALANLMSVDLGLGYIKVAVARPGKGLELVTNEQAKRKTPSAVGFTHEGERLFGDAAVAYAAKAPMRAILHGRDLIGQCASDDESTAPPSPFCDRKRLNLQGIGRFTGEEVVAMLLAMARRQASAALGGAKVKDVAITVPAWYDERERLAVADAARVIGMNCLGVVNANTAAALKYALDGKAKPTDDAIAAEKQKDKKKRAPKTMKQRVLFYDIGAGSASASVAEVTSDVKTGIASNVKMLSHAWEKGIGGRHLDSVIVERLADAFDKQRGSEATPSRDLPRVMMRLRKEAQRAREVLSANTGTFVSVASLHDDLDLRTTLDRADFEKDAKAMLELVGGPVKTALSNAKLTSEDLDAVVPFGGTSRTPKVQQALLETLGISSLNKSINTDEAAVMGSAFFGASLSSTFRVRKMDFEDTYGRSISAEFEKEAKSGGLFSGSGKPAVQTVEIFPEGSSKMPSKKTLSLSRSKDFGLKVYLGMDKSGSSRFSGRILYTKMQIKGVADVLKKLKDSSKAKNLTPRVALTFHVDRSGTIQIGTAESSVDETVVVEREVEVVEEDKNKTDKKSAESSQDEKSGKDASDSSESTKENADDAGASSNGEDTAKESSQTDNAGKNKEEEAAKNDKMKNKSKKKKTKIEKSTQTIVHRQTLTVEYDTDEGLLGMQMSGAELEAAKKTLKQLEDADKDRMQRADALNALEGFILEIRSKVRGLDEDDDLYKVSTEEERESLVQAFDEAEDWMYTDDAKQTANLRKKHTELQTMFQPVARRAAELHQRPEVFKALRKAADIGIEKTTASREIHMERKSTHLADLDSFIEYCKTVKEWVSEKEAQQAKSPLTEAPSVSWKELMEKVQEVQARADKIGKIELPPAPSEAPSDSSSESQKETEENTNATSTDTSSEKDEGLDAGAEVPSDPDADTAKSDAASGGASKEEL